MRLTRTQASAHTARRARVVNVVLELGADGVRNCAARHEDRERLRGARSAYDNQAADWWCLWGFELDAYR